MKSFLVPIGGSNTDGAVLTTALVAAGPFAAHLQFLHVRVSVDEAAQYTPHLDFAIGPALREALQELETQSHTRSVTAVNHVHEFCARSSIELGNPRARSEVVTASCREEEGNPLERVMFHARHSDLVIMGRASHPNGLSPDFLERLVLGCGRPVLIAAKTAPTTLTGTIMVCWRESADAARAVTAAAPFLAQAKRVVFASVVEKSEDTNAGIDDIVRQFAWHDVPTEARIIKQNGRHVQEVLASLAQDCEADLIVSGAYGHWRVREMIFGGCTQSFIRHSDRAILLMH
jgi:nucleotide-binding universal stress UspA family protein